MTAVKRTLGLLLAGFPDHRSRLEQVVAEGDAVVVRWTATGTHEGEYLGIAATGREATWTGIDVFRIDCGRIAEVWSEADGIGLLRQLGALPDIAVTP